MEKQIRTMCIFKKFEGDINDDIPISFIEEINIPFSVRYIEALSVFLVGEQDKKKYQTSTIINSNLINNENLCVTSQLSMISKNKISEKIFDGIYKFKLLIYDNQEYLLPKPVDPFFNKINEGYLILQLTFFE